MRERFTWNPDVGGTLECQPAIHKMAYGDGYSQRTGAGINPAPRTWALTLSVSKDVALAIDTFLRRHGGEVAFEWMDPRGHESIWVCERWSSVSRGNGGVVVVTARFEEDFQ